MEKPTKEVIVLDKEPKVRMGKKEARQKLWEMGNLEYFLKGKQKDIANFIKTQDGDISVVLASRRIGKCCSFDTYVYTTKGLKQIQYITTQDYVYSLDTRGRLEATQVAQVHKQGVKKVVSLIHAVTGDLIVKCTPDHKWFVHDKETKERYNLAVKDFTKDTQLIQKIVFESYVDVIIVDNQEEVETYDIGLDNETHLYLLQGGYVTHNSFVLCTLAVETCIKKGNSVVKYACPQKDQVQKSINHNIELIIQDAPAHMKPEWKEQRKLWLFPNGSQIQVAGTDKGNAESLRGGYSDLAICDEAGFMDDLDYIINSILAPTTDTTGGKVVLSSTPNYKDPNHEFHVNFIHPLEEVDRLIRFTIYDSPMVDQEKIQKIIARYPKGVDDPKFKCEYLCLIPTTADSSVIPEFTHEVAQEIVREVETPAYRDFYTSADPGFKDLTGAVFGYYDFRNARVVIMDELVMNGESMTTDSLARGIVEKERKTFVSAQTKEVFDPFLRIIDNNNLILVNDLFRLHNLQFRPTKKDNKEAQINQLRIMIAEKKLIIHPRCVNLIHQLKNIRWAKNGKEFARMKDSPDGYKANHADLVDSVIYLIRNINKHKNPYPIGYGTESGSNMSSGRAEQKENQNLMDLLFNRKPKIKL